MRSRIWQYLFCCGVLALGLAAVLGGGRTAAASDLAAVASVAAGADTAVAAVAPGDEIDFAAIEEMQGGANPPAGGKECSANTQCPKKEYCSKAAGECKGKGSCKERPQICPDIFKPVCGCNGRTYSNECWAAAAGVNVKSEGACDQQKSACKTNKDCPAGDFCAKETGKCDDSGTCSRRPEICPDVVDPVCGCNNKTYNNFCMANRAGVNVSHKGKCEK